MGSFKTVSDFLDANTWQLIQYIDLGTTAHVFVIERESEKCVLKTQRGGATVTCSLRLEHVILQYLNETDMAQYVPAVGEWIHEVDGFLMEHLRYPTPAERETYDLLHTLAVALRTLHGVDLPPIKDVADDRPLVSTAINRRLQDAFGAVTEDDSFWAGLSSEDKPRLEYVRTKYETYAQMLPVLKVSLADTECALMHGDLSGDNLMMRQDGSFVLTDWGETRITSSLTDAAYLLTHTEWNENKTQRFLRAYFNDDPDDLEEALPVIETLSCLYQYNSCVRSLLWLNSPEEDGLDSIGRAYFERQLRAL